MEGWYHVVEREERERRKRGKKEERGEWRKREESEWRKREESEWRKRVERERSCLGGEEGNHSETIPRGLVHFLRGK